jgi:hypothetical protein
VLQLPPTSTWQAAANSPITPYSQKPSANPGVHVQRYASIGTAGVHSSKPSSPQSVLLSGTVACCDAQSSGLATQTDAESVESLHAAPLAHGLLTHSSTSTPQLPPSATVQFAAYSAITPYWQKPSTKPTWHVHRYTSNAILESLNDSVHAASF